MRPLFILCVVACTFVVTRLLDLYFTNVPTLQQRHLREYPVGARAERLIVENAADIAEPRIAHASSPATAAALESRRAPTSPQEGNYVVVIGLPIGVNKDNRHRRHLLRHMWMTEYPNIGKTVRAEFVVGLLTHQGDGHDLETARDLHAEHKKYGDIAFVNAREATRDPYRGDPKCTGEKLVAWFRHVIVAHGSTPYFAKVGHAFSNCASCPASSLTSHKLIDEGRLGHLDTRREA